MKQKGSDDIEEIWTYGIQSVATPVNHHRMSFPLLPRDSDWLTIKETVTPDTL